MSGSISTLIEGKGKKGGKDLIVPKDAMNHFLNLMKVPQTGNPRPPPSDYERTMSMEKWQKRSRTVHKLNVAERAAFCKQNNMTELDLL